MQQVDEYNKQAKDFLAKTGVSFSAEFKFHGKYFEGDRSLRDVYEITLMSQTGQVFVFDFGQSVHHSGKYTLNVPTIYLKNILHKDGIPSNIQFHEETKEMIEKKVKRYRMSSLNDKERQALKNLVIDNPNFQAPNEYDVLACLTKYEPESLADFLHEMGYNENAASLKAGMKIYPKVVQEWRMVCSLWNEEQIEELQEIN